MRAYTYEEALAASVEYFGGDTLAAEVFVGKYCLKDSDNNYYELSPKDMHWRLAKEFARIEKKYPNSMSENDIFDLFDCFKYVIPQGSPMSAIGNKFFVQSLGNCFVIPPPEDSYGGILMADQHIVQLAKRRAGVGLNISKIRPKGTPTKNSAQTTDGIGVFMERFSNSCREVAQNGRRGAELMTISVHHPEIETFIHIKHNKTKVTGANVSVLLSDEFMRAVETDSEYEQRWPVDSKNPKISRMVRARDVWDQIIYEAWFAAEPGLLFEDTIKNHSPAEVYTAINPLMGFTAPNPCGEIVMGVDSCRLLVVNLFSFVVKPFTSEAYFDFNLYFDICKKAQRLMDDVVDLELEAMDAILAKIDSDPESEEIKSVERNLWKMMRKHCEEGRRTGLGITALADTLAALNVRYGSPKSKELVNDIYKNMAVASYTSSCEMARDRGAFPMFSHELEKGFEYIERIVNDNDYIKQLYSKYGRRNIANTTTAPTGSVSILTQTSSGIEPVFMIGYDRWRKLSKEDVNAKIDRVDDVGDAWQKYTVYHHNFNKWKSVTGLTNVEDSPYYKATAMDVDWVAGCEIQAIAQKWVCHAISRTANLPKDATQELVSEIYLKAWKLGCKGYTVYRDGCRDGVLTSVEEKKPEPEKKEPLKKDAPRRPKTLPSETHKIRMDLSDEGIRNAYVTVSFYEGQPYEILIGTPHSGLTEKDLQILELSSRMTSMCLRHGVPLHFICEQLDKIGGQYIHSVPVSLARTLRQYFEQPEEKEAEDAAPIYTKCPSCKAKTYRMTGQTCGICDSCGYSGCS